jgi:Pvc16 N-terminal domain
MSLAQSSLALGAVTSLITNRLNAFTKGTNVTATRPERARKKGANPKLNVFLYETIFDASLRNFSLDAGRPAPLWLVLKYLLTAFDEDDDSDTAKAHGLLGQGLSALQELAYLPIDSSLFPELSKNPEPLKITFDEITADVISKLMQGSDEKYRLSVGFQVRPVMIAPPEPPSYSLLVGSRFVNVLPSLGISLDAVTPPSFELNSPISIVGSDLNLSGVEVLLGSTPLTILPPVTSAKLDCQVTTAAMSAGSYPLAARRTLSPGRFRSSNILVANLLPTVATAQVTPGRLTINGQLLGTGSDDVVVAFYRNGVAEKIFDEGFVFDPGQIQLDLTVPVATILPPDTYLIILRVNGQQARNSPAVTWP